MYDFGPILSSQSLSLSVFVSAPYQHKDQHRRDERAVEQPGRLHPHAEIRLGVGGRIDGQRNRHNAERQAVRQQIVPDDLRRFLHLQQNLLGGEGDVQLEAWRWGGGGTFTVIKCCVRGQETTNVGRTQSLTLDEHPRNGAQEGAVQKGGREAGQPAGLGQRNADDEQHLQHQHASVQVLGDGDAVRLRAPKRVVFFLMVGKVGIF